MEDPRRIHVELPLVRLSALDYGEPSPGAVPVLLLHGQADLAWSMHPIAAALSARYRVISLDLRGHGDSDQPGMYSLMHFISDVAGVVEALDLQQPVIVGHSLGGQIAAQYCGLFPEVPRALVVAEGIGPPVRMSAGGVAARLARSRGLAKMAGQPLRPRPMVDLDDAAARLARAHQGLDAERARFLAEAATRPGPDGGLVWKFDPYSRHWILSHDHERAEERWNAVRCPVLVVTGADAWERWWKTESLVGKADGEPAYDPTEVGRRVGQFADVEHHDLPDAGHMLPYDAPDRLAGLIADFLARRLPSGAERAGGG